MWLEFLEKNLSQVLNRRSIQRLLERIGSKNERSLESLSQPSEQWLAKFCSVAAHTKNDAKMDLLSRLLDREGQSLGSVCVRALRVVDELEDDEIEILVNDAASRICRSYSETQSFIPEGALPGDAITTLQDSGLASETVMWNSSGPDQVIAWKHSTIVIVIAARGPEIHMFPMSAGAVLLSRAGQDIFSCISPETPCVRMIESLEATLGKHFEVGIADSSDVSDAVPIRQWIAMHP